MKPGNIMKTLMAAQAAMSNVQKELEISKFEGTSGGGLIKLTINGKGEMLKVAVDPVVLKEDAETVAELFMAAANAAALEKERVSKEKLKAATGSLLPLGLKVPGMG